MSKSSTSIDFTRTIAITALFGAACLAAPLSMAHAQSVDTTPLSAPGSSSYSQTTSTTSTAPGLNNYSATSATKSIDANGDEVVKNKTYVATPAGTRASSVTEVKTPDGGSMTTTHEEHTSNPSVETTSTHTSTSTETH